MTDHQRLRFQMASRSRFEMLVSSVATLGDVLPLATLLAPLLPLSFETSWQGYPLAALLMRPN